MTATTKDPVAPLLTRTSHSRAIASNEHSDDLSSPSTMSTLSNDPLIALPELLDPLASKVVEPPSYQLIADSSIQSSKPPSTVMAGQNINVPTAGAGPSSHVTVAIGSLTLRPQDPIATLSGTPIPFNLDALIIGSSTIAFASSLTDDSKNAQPQAYVVVVAGQTVSIPTIGATDIAIGSQTLNLQTAAAAVSGTLISPNPDAPPATTATTSTLAFLGGGAASRFSCVHYSLLLATASGTITVFLI
ncbi:hypothetical protein MMC20_006545 [Loxospora ochrophaea]|nr:hypothetical protein [Loxospora ochrophaea]